MVKYRGDTPLRSERSEDMNRQQTRLRSGVVSRHLRFPVRATLVPLLMVFGSVTGCDCRSSGEKFLAAHDSDAAKGKTVESARAQFGEPSEYKRVDAESFRRLNKDELVATSSLPTNFEGSVDVLVWREYCWFRLSDVMFAVADPESGRILELKTFSVLRRPSMFERRISAE